MKGDCTRSQRVLPLPVDGDHPRMKGDCTRAVNEIVDALMEITPE